MTRRRQWELITIITGARWPDVKPRSSLDAVVIVTPATFNYIARHVTRGVAITSHVTSRRAWLRPGGPARSTTSQTAVHITAANSRTSCDLDLDLVLDLDLAASCTSQDLELGVDAADSREQCPARSALLVRP